MAKSSAPQVPSADAPFPPGRLTSPAPALVRHALIPCSIVLCFALVYWVRTELWVAALAGAGFMALYLSAPWIGQNSLARFDRAMLPILAKGEVRALESHYRMAWGMRLFAPPALVAERRGLVAAHTRAHHRARAAYQRALDGYAEGGAPLSVVLGLAHAHYAVKDDREAVRAYRAVLKRSDTLPNVSRNLAHALARRGEDLKEAAELLDQVSPSGSEEEPDIKLIRALIHAKRKHRGPARKLLKQVRKVHSDEIDAMREEVEDALGEASA